MSQFVNLAFEGGGVKGIAYAGSLKVLEERNIMPDIRRVAGTSAGAITATLVALGAKGDDVGDIVGGTNFRKFMDDSWGVFRDIDRLIDNYGWFKGDEFSKWMKKIVKDFTDEEDLTFAQLKSLARDNPGKFRELTMVGTNLTKQLPEIFNAEQTPNRKIWEAARISMSIPFFFAAHRETEEGDVRVDGGVTWNYPLDLYDKPEYLSNSANNALFEPANYPTLKWDGQIFNKETLGFRVDTKDEIATLKHKESMPPKKIDTLPKYIAAIVGFMNDMANKSHLHENDWHRTVFIDALGISTTDFDLSDDDVQRLINSGVTSTNEYLDWLATATPATAKNKV